MVWNGAADLSASLALFSAVAVLLLGAWTLAGGRSRPRGGLAFGLFAILWGFHIVFGNLAEATEASGLSSRLYLLGVSCLALLPYLLVEFARDQSLGQGQQRTWLAARVITGTVAVGTAAALLFEPGWILQGTSAGPNGPVPEWAPLYTVLQASFFLALGFVLWLLWHNVRTSPTQRTADRASLFVIGISLYLSYSAGYWGMFYGGWAAFYGPSSQNIPFALLFGVLFVECLVLGYRSWTRSRLAPTPAERRGQRLIALAMVGPMTWGLVEGAIALELVPRLYTTGFWRLAGVAVIAYGVARWRDFSLPQRMRRVACTAAGASGSAAGGAAAFALGATLTSGLAAPLVAGLGVVGISLAPSLRLARRLFGIDETANPIDFEETLYEQRIDSYRAAVEASMARGTLQEDEPFLGSLRERYGISDEEDRVVRYYARTSVVVTREGTVADTYEKLRILGEGGGGRTWLARDRSRDRLVVLKEPLPRWQQEPGLRERFLEEARTGAKVRHPNVVRIEEVIDEGDQPVIVMEHIEGGSLEDLLRARGVLHWRDAVAILHDVLTGLTAVHAREIVHRDIKPANLLITDEGRAKIADFGIAGCPRQAGDTAMEGPGATTAGTRGYMAPEVRGGDSMGDQRSDVYACGAVLHECLYGTPPGRGQAVLAENHVPAPIEEALAKALATDPRRRFASAQAFAAAIARGSQA